MQVQSFLLSVTSLENGNGAQLDTLVFAGDQRRKFIMPYYTC